MRTLVPLFVIVVGATISVSGCGRTQGHGCTTESQCSIGQICDTEGRYGPANTCADITGVDPDAEPGCEQHSDCASTSKPVCDVTEGVCRACTLGDLGDAECAAAGAGTYCVAGSCVDCRDSIDCSDDAAPFCDSDFQCSLCVAGTEGDIACAARNAENPYCGSQGMCVACLLSEQCQEPTTPVCEPVEGRCRRCQSHSECSGPGICDFPSGMCLRDEDIVWVDRNSMDSSATCGSVASPCRTIGDGLDKVDDARWTMRIEPGMYQGRVSIAGIRVNLVANGVTVDPVDPGLRALEIRDSADVRIEGLRVTGASGGANTEGVYCENATARLQNVTVEGNESAGIKVSGCTFELWRSTVSDNRGGGIDIGQSHFIVVNNFIVTNGNVTSSSFGGMHIVNTSSIEFTQQLEFNTIVYNQSLAMAADSSGVDCIVTTPMTGRNNIVYAGLVGAAPDVDGNCTWEYSHFGDSVEGNGNGQGDPKVVSLAGGDFHLASDSPCIDRAAPSATIDTDFDGDTRPAGEAPDIGADEYVMP